MEQIQTPGLENVKTPDLVARVLNKELIERERIDAQVDLVEEIHKEDKHSKISKVEIYDVLLKHGNGKVDKYYIALSNYASGKHPPSKKYFGDQYPTPVQIRELFHTCK